MQGVMFLVCRHVVLFCCVFMTVKCIDIYREKRDIVTNVDNREDQCREYHATCLPETDCRYCQCREDKRTFVVQDETNKGMCIADEDLNPESVPNERFQLQNNNHLQCLSFTPGVNKYVIGSGCDSHSLEASWLWIRTSRNLRSPRYLVNVKTLQCAEISSHENNMIILKPCKVSNTQKLWCYGQGQIIKSSGNPYFFKLSSMQRDSQGLRYLVADSFHNRQMWSKYKKNNLCNKVTTYKGCYRFSDGSFMAYLEFPSNLATIKKYISAPIFASRAKCSLKSFQHKRNKHEWLDKTEGMKYFSTKKINESVIELEIKTDVFHIFNGSLLKLSVKCGSEVHCVLFKLQSMPGFSQMTSPAPSSPPTSYFASETDSPSDTETRPSITSTIPTAGKEVEQKLESGATSTVAIAVTVPTVLIILLLIGAYLLFFRKKKRSQEQVNNRGSKNNQLANGYNENHYESDRTYETMKEDERDHVYERLHTPDVHLETNAGFYATHGALVNPAIIQNEYMYTDIPMTPTRKEDEHVKNVDIPKDDAFYHSLEESQPSNSAVYSTLEEPNGDISLSTHGDAHPEEPTYNVLDDSENGISST